MCGLCALHNHSEYSAIDGISTAKELAARAVEIGMSSMGLTDHGVVTGHLDFAKELTKVGVKPIFGVEAYHGVRHGEKIGSKRDQAHLILLAQSDEGLKNVWRIVDSANQIGRFHNVGRCMWEDLENYREGVIATSACVAGLVPQEIMRGKYDSLNKYLEIFGDNFFIEISTYPETTMMMDRDLDEPVSMGDVNKRLIDVARERGIGLVYGDDGHYAFPDQFDAHDAYVARATGQSIYDPVEDRKMYHPPQALVIKTEEEVRESLSYLPDDAVDEALANSIAIAESCNAALPKIKRHIPNFIPNDSPWVERGKYETGTELFIDLVEKGIIKRYGADASDEIWNRAIMEMEVFIESRLENIFLMDWDKTQFVIHEDIERGPARGSAGGSIVAFALEITDIDPIKYGLWFERFWNPGRAEGFPDIDSDISQAGRGKVKDYLMKRWGNNRVRSIGTTLRMKPKSLVGKLSSACGVTYSEEDALKKIIEKTPDLEILGVDQIGWSRETDPGKVVYIMEAVGEEIVDWVSSQPNDRIDILIHFLDLCEVLCNRVSAYGVHASGMVISDVDLDAELPARYAGTKADGIPVTSFPMDDVDKRGFIKLDVLGLKTLDTLEDWKRQMSQKGVKINWSGLEWTNYDESIWDVLSSGYSAGVFQVEDGFAKKLGEDIRPRSVEDMSAIVALNRPGPIRSGAVTSFVKRRNGEVDDAFDGREIELLKDNLEPTEGIFLYQEQVIKLFSDLGYSASDADAVRKIIGKKQPEKLQALYDGSGEWDGKSYISMCLKSGWDKALADRIWNLLIEFAKYSFNRAHSVGYGVVSFRCVYAKSIAAPEFYLACIRTVDNSKKKNMVPAYISEARRQGIEVLPPDVKYSQAQAAVRDDRIVFGFSDVKGIGPDSAEFLVKLRDEMGVDISTPESLHEAIESMAKDRSNENKKRKKEGLGPLPGKSAKQLLQANKIESLVTAGAWDRLGYRDDMSIKAIQACEKEMLSVIITDNSGEILENNADAVADCDSYEDAEQKYDGDRRWTLPGVVTTVTPTVTKAKKEPMGIVTIEYESHELRFAVFPQQWKSSKFLFRERTPGIFTIRQNDRGYNFESGIKLK